VGRDDGRNNVYAIDATGFENVRNRSRRGVVRLVVQGPFGLIEHKDTRPSEINGRQGKRDRQLCPAKGSGSEIVDAHRPAILIVCSPSQDVTIDPAIRM